MGYRGEDLDLRTPQTWSASPADLAGWSQVEAGRGRPGAYAARSGPIWVDETVLACCNHAFDLALLNRASEVRLEHLVHALTRIDAAADALEGRGIRVAALRRDSATVIASEIPVGLPNGKGVPRRSDHMEDILRMAAGHAARRNAPASVEDLLHIMLDQEPGLPGLSLLARNSGRYAAAPEPLPPLTRPAYVAEPRLADFQDSTRGRPAYGTYYYAETPRPARVDIGGTPTDSIQNSRLDALEQTVRALGADLSNERKFFSAMLQDLQRDLGAQRDDTSRFSGGVFERLQAVDAGFEKRLSDLSRTWSILSDRLQSLEGAVLSQRPAPHADMSPLHERLGSLERALLNIAPGAPAEMGPLSERLGSIERAFQSSLAESVRACEVLGDRVKAVETVLRNRPVAGPDGTVDLSPLTSRLDMIEEGILSRESATREIAERIGRIEDLGAGDRLRAREDTQRLAAELASLSATIEPIKRDTVTAVFDPLDSRLEGLAGVVEGRHTSSMEAIAGLAEKVAGLADRLASAERSAGEQALRFAEQQRAYAQELAEVHDALVKLNANQHTLAATIDQWRADAASALSLLGSRMDGVEQAAQRPAAMLEALSGPIAKIHKVTVERHYRRSRLWYWLFGTEDWVGASWPSQAQRIVDDLRSVKTKAKG
jgi:predicted  nucleic acid-binding Zn-ribbon protein